MELEWAYNLAFFFSLLMIMMLSGMPVAFGFITLNILGLYLYLGPGSLALLATSSFSSIGQFFPDPDPAVHFDGRAVDAHRPGGQDGGGC